MRAAYASSGNSDDGTTTTAACTSRQKAERLWAGKGLNAKAAPLVDQIGWDQPLKLDLFPYRENAVEAVRNSLDVIDTLRERAGRIAPAELAEIRAANDALAAQRLVQKALFG